MKSPTTRWLIGPRGVLTDGQKSVLLGILFYAIADAGLFSNMDAGIFAIAAALLAPRFAPCLLILIGSVQDGAGLANQWWYPAFGVVGLIQFYYYFANSAASKQQLGNADMPFKFCVSFAICVFIYGYAVSVVQNSFGGFLQSPERPPVLVAGLGIFMVVSAFISTRLLFSNDELRHGFRNVLILAVAHALFVCIVQATVNIMLFHSAAGIRSLASSAQLTEKTAFGIPRLSGTYLTPNGFAFYFGFLMVMIVYLGGHAKKTLRHASWVFLSFGIALSVASMSKSVALFMIGTWLLIMFWAYGLRSIAIIALLTAMCAIIIGSFGLTHDGSAIVSAFRIPLLSTAYHVRITYRYKAWHYVLTNFSWMDWLFGTGLASWPMIFQEHLGFPLADPHTWLLSIPGSFGIIGAVFCMYLFIALATKSCAVASGQRYLSLIALYFIFFICLFDVMILLGNTPLTYVLYVIVGLALYKSVSHQLDHDVVPEDVEDTGRCRS